MQRRDFLAAGLATAALSHTTSAQDVATDQAAVAETVKRFNLSYGPHEGQFKNLGGADIVEQINFAASQGFRSWEDNRATQRTPEEQERIGQALADNDTQMGVFVVSPLEDNFTKVTFAGDDDALKDKVLKAIKDGVAIAKRMNATWMTVVPGLYDPKLAWDYQTANVVELLRRCSEILEPHDLVMVLEPLNHRTNHPGVFLTGTPQSYSICRAVNSPACKILYDIYHQQITEGNLINNIDLAWSEIAYIQAGDNPGRKEPGTGEINYRNVFKHLHEKGFEGVVGMEHGMSKKGEEGERMLIEAYRDADNF